MDLTGSMIGEPHGLTHGNACEAGPGTPSNPQSVVDDIMESKTIEEISPLYAREIGNITEMGITLLNSLRHDLDQGFPDAGINGLRKKLSAFYFFKGIINAISFEIDALDWELGLPETASLIEAKQEGDVHP